MATEEDRWSRLVSVVSRLPASAAEREAALYEALRVGASITADSVGCSITEMTPSGFHTPAASNELALALDLAQYNADDGPCVAACRDRRAHSIVVMGDETAYAGFTAAAMAHNVRSSLSLPVPGTLQASALNLYASSTSAFESSHARNVTQLLVRCVAAFLPSAAEEHGSVSRQAVPEWAQAAHDLVVRATQILCSRGELDSAAAFHRLTQLSRTEQRSIYAIARDIEEDSGKQVRT